MRTVLVIRHAVSKANGVSPSKEMTAEELAFANMHAELRPEGEADAAELAIALYTKYGIVASRTPVAISKYTRTRQTAKLLGFRKGLTTPYSELNEVDHGMDIEVLRGMLRQNQIPPVALEAASVLLDQQPDEDVWVTHGLLTAGLCMVLGIADQYGQPVPRCCETRLITL